ncbi:hypothetical protein [Methanolapillus ohkumae]|uniref:Immunoglobulin domain-containing protein n=1 Tax=Methanolapillus ohkumae TaxID=3028298 RepID=A0AA96V4E2_9EURY|nr:hypothetical protein MsAm2_01430 [Methanosarcinaceae archaeon Am2]
MNGKVYKKIGIVFLTLLLLFAMVPGTAMAASIQTNLNGTYSYLTGDEATLTFKGKPAFWWVDDTGFSWEYKKPSGSWTKINANKLYNGTDVSFNVKGLDNNNVTVKITTVTPSGMFAQNGTSTLKFQSTMNLNGYQFRVCVGENELYSNTATLNVYNRAMVSELQSTAVFVETTDPSFTTTAPDDMKYEWYRSNDTTGNTFSLVHTQQGGETSTYSPQVTLADNGHFYKVKTSAGPASLNNYAESAPVELTVFPTPTVVPSNVFEQTESVSFTGPTEGTNYKWNKAGEMSPVYTSTSNTYYIDQDNVTVDKSGTYTLTMTYNGQEITSKPFYLTVYSADLIDEDQTPEKYVVFLGSNDVSMTVNVKEVASPIESYEMEWWFGGSQISGETTSTLIRTSGTANGGTYEFKIFGIENGHRCCSDSIFIELIVLDQPAANPNPVFEGKPTTLSVGNGNIAEITYNWKLESSPVGENSYQYVILDADTTNHAGNYTVTASVGTGTKLKSDTSKPFNLKVYSKPTVTLDLNKTSAFAEQEIGVTVTPGNVPTAAGTTTAFELFQVNSSGGDDISLGTVGETDTLVPTAPGANEYYVVMTTTLSNGDFTTSKSSEISLTVYNKPTVTVSPTSSNEHAAIGGTFIFTANVVQDTTLPAGATVTYQWYLVDNTDPTTPVLTPVGTNSNMYNAPLDAVGTFTYAVSVTTVSGDANIAVSSDPVILTVYLNPEEGVAITQQPTDVTVAVGNNAELTVVATGAVSYQWQKYNTATTAWDDVGINSSIFPITGAVDDDDDGTYRVVVTGIYGETVTSNEATVSVIDDPATVSITKHPADVIVAVGNNAELTVVATNANTYQWQKQNGAIWEDVGTNASIFSITNAVEDNEGTYRVIITGTAGDTAISDEADVTVNAADATTVLITQQPADVIVAVGNNAELTVVATNANTYQWQKQNGAIWEDVGTNASIFSITNAVEDNEGTYRVIITGTAGDTAISDEADVTVNAADATTVLITQQPADVIVAVGNNAELTVVATNANTYQWQKQNGAIWEDVGTNASIFSITNAVEDNEGTYRVIITGTAGDTAISDEADVTVNAADATTVLITQQPADVIVAVGNNAELTVVATNANTYQWQKQNGAIWEDVGTNASIFSITNAVEDNEGTYRVIITGTAGDTAISDEADVTVNAADATTVLITQQPADVIVAVGNNAELTVVATNANTYQWQKQNGAIWEDVGTNASIFSITNAVEDNEGTYRVIITGTAGDTAISDEADVTVNAADATTVLITQQPADVIVAVGNNAELTVVATNANTYQWQKQNGAIWEDVGTNASIFSITSAVEDNEGTYRVIITGTGGDTAISNSAAVSVIDVGPATVSITKHPADVTVAVGNNAELTVVATNAAAYQWQKQNGAIWENVTGETNPTLSFASAQLTDAGTYRVTITGTGGDTAISNSATVSVIDVGPATVSITKHPADVTVAVGNNAELTVVAENAVSYKWQKQNGAIWEDVTGETNPTLSFASAQLTDAGTYRVIVTGTETDTAISNNATVTVISANPETTISITGPDDVTVTIGNNAQLSVIATNAAAYQWQKKNGTVWDNIGTDSSSLPITSASADDAGIYRVIVTGSVNANEMAISREATVTVRTGGSSGGSTGEAKIIDTSGQNNNTQNQTNDSSGSQGFEPAEEPPAGDGKSLEEKSTFPWWILLVLLLLIAAGIGYWYFFIWKKKQKEGEE